MGDGWETARQPLRPACYKRQADGLMLLPGQDWALIKCGTCRVVFDMISTRLLVNTLLLSPLALCVSLSLFLSLSLSRVCVVWHAGLRGTVRHIEVDTNFFKGNYPESCVVSKRVHCRPHTEITNKKTRPQLYSVCTYASFFPSSLPLPPPDRGVFAASQHHRGGESCPARRRKRRLEAHP